MLGQGSGEELRTKYKEEGGEVAEGMAFAKLTINNYDVASVVLFPSRHEDQKQESNGGDFS